MYVRVYCAAFSLFFVVCCRRAGPAILAGSGAELCLQRGGSACAVAGLCSMQRYTLFSLFGITPLIFWLNQRNIWWPIAGTDKSEDGFPTQIRH